MTSWCRPTEIRAGQLLYLELLEFPDRPRAIVRVVDLLRDGRVQVGLAAGDQTLFNVERAVLWLGGGA